MRVVTDQQERDLVEVAQEAGAGLVCGTSLKAALDRDWDQQIQKDEALSLVLQVLHTVDAWVKTLTDEEDKAVAEPILTIAKQVEAQDVQISEKGKASLIKGIAKDGRKSRSVRVDRSTRHVLHDPDTGLIRAVGITSPMSRKPA